MLKSISRKASPVKTCSLLELDPDWICRTRGLGWAEKFMCERTSETQQEQSCTSIGKSIILTYFTNLKDRATKEISDFEWKSARFSYCLQSVWRALIGLIGPKYCLGRPLLYVAQKKSTAFVALYFTSPRRKIPLRNSPRRPEEKIPLRNPSRRPVEKFPLGTSRSPRYR